MSELVIETAGKIVIVTIDRPPVNALTIALYGQIADTFEELGKRTDVHCAIITGRGTRAFCAGLDLRVLPADRQRLRSHFRRLRRCDSVFTKHAAFDVTVRL